MRTKFTYHGVIMAKRKAISKRTRFEVLKRDSFTCQYCGKMPPDTTLHIDHIKPVSKGGTNGMLNLVTSCVDCNLGKSNIELSDDSAVKRQQSQLSEMAEKKLQIEMMVEWRESLLNADEILVESVKKLINTYLEAFDREVSDAGVTSIRKAIKNHGYQLVIDSIENLYKSNKDFNGNWSKAIKYCDKKSKPNLHYAKGIMKNRFPYFNEKQFYHEMSALCIDDEFVEQLIEIAKSCNSCSNFYERIDEVI